MPSKTPDIPPSVQVFIPTFNHRDYIAETLDSVLSQKTSFSVDIIIHDDASTDGTRAIIEQYVEKYPDKIFAILQEKNQWSQGRRIVQFAWPHFKAKYIAFLDGDDLWTSDEKLQVQVDFMERHKGCALCQTATLYYSEIEHQVVQHFPWKKRRRTRHFFDDFAAGNFVQSSAAMFRLSALPELPEDFSTLPFGDYARFALMAKNGWVGFIDEEMVKYRIHGDNMWANSSKAGRKLKIQQVQDYLTRKLPPERRRPWFVERGELKRTTGFRLQRALRRWRNLARSYLEDILA